MMESVPGIGTMEIAKLFVPFNDESCFVRDNKLIAVFRSSFSNRLD